MLVICRKGGLYRHIRQTKLLDIVNREQKVSVTDLAEALNVSEVTIRKDLTALEQKGLLHREHGYAVMSASNEALHQLSFNYERKRRIAVRAAESVKNGETVMLTSGTCCTLLAEELAIQKNDVTIITNSAFLAAFIRKYPKTHVILLGGDYQNDAQVRARRTARQGVRLPVQCRQDFREPGRLR